MSPDMLKDGVGIISSSIKLWHLQHASNTGLLLRSLPFAHSSTASAQITVVTSALQCCAVLQQEQIWQQESAQDSFSTKMVAAATL